MSKRLHLTPEHRRKISEALKGRKKLASVSSEGQKRFLEAIRKPVVQIDPKTEEPLEVYESQTAAAKALGISPNEISRVCNGKRKTAGKFRWRFID